MMSLNFIAKWIHTVVLWNITLTLLRSSKSSKSESVKSIFPYCSVLQCWLHTHSPVGPALLNTGDSPELVNILCQLLSDTLQVGWQHNLYSKGKSANKNLINKTDTLMTYSKSNFRFWAFTWTVSTGQGVNEVWVRDRVGPSRLRTPSKSCLYSLMGSIRILSLGSRAS